MDRDNAWLLDMLTYSQRVLDVTAGLSYDEFDANSTLQYAVIHLITVVGEAAAQVTDSRRNEFPNIPWSQIVGTRNRLVHHYFKIETNILWEVIQTHLPQLIVEL